MEDNKIYGINDVNKHGQIFLFRGETMKNDDEYLTAPVTGWYDFKTMDLIDAQPELDGFLND